jgi:hypothetical protein
MKLVPFGFEHAERETIVLNFSRVTPPPPIRSTLNERSLLVKNTKDDFTCDPTHILILHPILQVCRLC